MELLLLIYDFSLRFCKLAEEMVDLRVKAFSSLHLDCSIQVFKLVLAEIFDIFFLGNLHGWRGGEARHELDYFFISLWLVAHLLEHLLKLVTLEGDQELLWSLGWWLYFALESRRWVWYLIYYRHDSS